MSSQLTVNKQLLNNVWVVTAEVVPGGTLPLNIFVYENTGTATLGNFYGTADVNDLTRMQIWSATPIPVFGNRFVLSDQAKINVDQGSDPDSVINALVTNVKSLSTNLQAINTSTQTIPIP